jgi:hypothetical protein
MAIKIKGKAKHGILQGKIIRDQLEQARAAAAQQRFRKLGGTVRRPKELSKRKGFTAGTSAR